MQLDDKMLIDAGLIHSIHTSERKAFRACRRRWDWAYRQDLHPTVTAKPLEFGIAWHVAMEVWYDPDMWLKNREQQHIFALSAFNRVVTDQLKIYKELNGTPTDEVLADYKEHVALGTKMLKYYTSNVSPNLDKDLTPLAVEVPFEVPMDMYCKCDMCWHKFTTSRTGMEFILQDWQDRSRNESKCPCVDDGIETDLREHSWREHHWQGLLVTFGGRIDAIFSDQHGRIWVFDWKTTDRIMDDIDEAAFLQLDDQVGGYPAALWKLGRQVDGFIYHEQRKAIPELPRKLDRLYKGRSFSTDKTAPIVYKTFLDTILREDLRAYNMGLYDDYLQFLQTSQAPKFFQRNRILKTDIQMENFWNDLKSETMDIIGDPRVYPAASRFSCNKCLYRAPCEGMNRGEDYAYTLNSMFIKGRR